MHAAGQPALPRARLASRQRVAANLADWRLETRAIGLETGDTFFDVVLCAIVSLAMSHDHTPASGFCLCRYNERLELTLKLKPTGGGKTLTLAPDAAKDGLLDDESDTYREGPYVRPDKGFNM